MLIMSRNSIAAKNLQELIAWLKANPDNVTFGTGGLASPPHISGLSLQAVTGNKFQFVPFRGSRPRCSRCSAASSTSSSTRLPPRSRLRKAAACAPMR